MRVQPIPNAIVSLYQQKRREKFCSIFGRNQQEGERSTANMSYKGPASSQAGNKCWFDGRKGGVKPEGDPRREADPESEIEKESGR